MARESEGEIIEKAFPKKTKLELFAREKKVGWDSWGNEIESDVEIKNNKINGVNKNE